MPHGPHHFEGPLLGERFRLGPLLGQGGQGSTYLAHDENTGHLVAIKELALAKADDWKAFELFERECRVLHELDHPNIPRYLAELKAEAESAFYLVMELVPGQSLRRRLQEHGPFDEEALWTVFWNVLDTLAYLHARRPPIVHRDVKPSNLIWRPDGGISLVDFGGVRDFFRTEGGSTVVGTFGYMAPEQLHGQAVPATDLYSLGATLVALGSDVEPERIPRKGLRMKLSGQLDVSRKMMRLLKRLTQPNPEDRPETAGKLYRELRGKGLDPAEPLPADAMAERSTERLETPSSPSSDLVHKEEPGPFLPTALPRPVRLGLGALVALLATLTHLFLVLVDDFVVPTLFALAEVVVPHNKLKRHEARQKETSAAIRHFSNGASRLSRRGLSEVWRALGPGGGRARKRLPPGSQ